MPQLSLYHAEIFSSKLPSDPGIKIYVTDATMEEKEVPQRGFFGLGPEVIDRKTGQLIYTVGGRVLAVAFNPDTLAASGVAVPLVGSVLVTPDSGAVFALNDRGTLVYTSGTPAAAVRRRLLWVDREGSIEALPIAPSAFEAPRLSPDGRNVAVTVRDVIADGVELACWRR